MLRWCQQGHRFYVSMRTLNKWKTHPDRVHSRAKRHRDTLHVSVRVRVRVVVRVWVRVRVRVRVKVRVRVGVRVRVRG